MSIRQRYRALRQASAPLRRWLRSKAIGSRVQRTAPLEPADRMHERKRWHVLVDLLNKHCPEPGQRVVEIGTASGYTSSHLLKYCPQIEHAYAVDLCRPDPDHDFVTRLERATFLQGDSAETAARFEDGSLDLIFVDADHSEKGVGRDLEAWVPKVRPGGVIAGHDYGSHNHPGVQIAIDRFFAEWPVAVRLEANKVWWTRG